MPPAAPLLCAAAAVAAAVAVVTAAEPRRPAATAAGRPRTALPPAALLPWAAPCAFAAPGVVLPLLLLLLTSALACRLLWLLRWLPLLLLASGVPALDWREMTPPLANVDCAAVGVRLPADEVAAVGELPWAGEDGFEGGPWVGEVGFEGGPWAGEVAGEESREPALVPRAGLAFVGLLLPLLAFAFTVAAALGVLERVPTASSAALALTFTLTATFALELMLAPAVGLGAVLFAVLIPIGLVLLALLLIDLVMLRTRSASSSSSPSSSLVSLLLSPSSLLIFAGALA